MDYCTPNEVIGSYDKLRDDIVTDKIPDILSEASRLVRVALSGLYDNYQYEQYATIPDTIKTLTIFKARELAFIAYYDGDLPENGLQAEWEKKYNDLLVDIRNGNVTIESEVKMNKTKAVFI